MLILINLTGLTKWYILPKIQYCKNKDLWFFGFNFLQLQIVVLSNVMASELFDAMNQKWPGVVKYKKY